MYGNGRAVWLPVSVAGVESNGSVNVILEWDNSVKLNVKSKDIQLRSGVEFAVDDLIQLEYPNDASILHSIGDHFRRASFLCRLGRSFLWINPLYRNIKEIGYHQNFAGQMSRSNSSTPSHLDMYTLAEEVRKIVSDNLASVSVIFRGISGSGKTELSKYIIQYLMFRSSNSTKSEKNATEISNYLPLGHASNPILTTATNGLSRAILGGIFLLDTFGSAPTEKNPTASRLLRVTRFQYDLSKSFLVPSHNF
jgi:myosin heavy subunit